MIDWQFLSCLTREASAVWMRLALLTMARLQTTPIWQGCSQVCTIFADFTLPTFQVDQRVKKKAAQAHFGTCEGGLYNISILFQSLTIKHKIYNLVSLLFFGFWWRKRFVFTHGFCSSQVLCFLLNKVTSWKSWEFNKASNVYIIWL